MSVSGGHSHHAGKEELMVGPFQMHLASVCYQTFPSGYLPKSTPEIHASKAYRDLENDTVTQAPIAQGLL